jgi:hypothetical protein
MLAASSTTSESPSLHTSNFGEKASVPCSIVALATA